MSEIQPAAGKDLRVGRTNPGLCLLRLFARLLGTIVVGSVVTVFYCAWHLSFLALCMFRPVVNLLVPAGLVMVPLSIAAFVKPEAANGIPFWAILLMAIGVVGIATGYAKLSTGARHRVRPIRSNAIAVATGADVFRDLDGAHGLTKRLALAASFISLRRK
ncbi:hypothetical protein LB553_12740 [Mesorhizobium sp. CA8]|uniref:hypothetical protein n=1 Tax=unclassified Mesorhizobium TaxID=325217 RepID=UPI001CCF41D9|nr:MULTISPECIES: hypothetical protein [unclassified Mesorhizobium]MBZ9761734.1 hypothetical protein [Mesorhizobium sp. CA8]